MFERLGSDPLRANPWPETAHCGVWKYGNVFGEGYATSFACGLKFGSPPSVPAVHRVPTLAVRVSLGVKSERTLYHVLVMGLKASDAAVNVRPNLDLISSNETLAAAELYLAGRQNRDRVLRDRLGAVAEGYDVVILDCSPSLSLMNQNALVFADGILVPVACDFLSLVGVRQVIKTVKNVNALLHHPVQIYGVLPTFYDARARICRDAVETLKQHFGDRCLAPIRSTIKIKEAPAQGKTIFEYAPDSHAAEDYRRVVQRIIEGPAAVTAPASDREGFEDSARATA